MLLTDLQELKAVLEIDPDNKTEDKKLLFLIEYASSWIQNLLNRDFEKKERTEFYAGTGTEKICLRARPVFDASSIQVYLDGNAYFGATSGSFGSITQLTYGQDFALKLDASDRADGLMNLSRCGILLRMNQIWQRPFRRQQGYLSPFVGEAYGNVKVTYTGGYTIDTLPAQISAACNILCGKLRMLMPLGSMLTSESYEERSVGYFIPHRRLLLADIWPMIGQFRNHNMGGTTGY